MNSIAISGYHPDDPDDPFVIIGGALLDEPLLEAPILKERREDIQILSCLQAIALVGAAHPLQLHEGDDPPDRCVEAASERWGVELTELTVEDVRGDLARMRRFGRQLESRLNASDEHAHLKGRVVQLSITKAGNELPRDTGDLLAELFAALAEDKGFMGEGADFSGGLPQKLPMDRGVYGAFGPLFAHVGSHGRPETILVSSAPQAQLHHREALEALSVRVAEKDREPNEILIVSCGLPDERGYVCQVDHFIFQALWDARAAQSPPEPLVPDPDILDGVLLHQFGGALLEVYRRPGTTLPWSPPEA